ncbi:MAG: sigma-70 family RNA polymerase sigma factor [Ignavibacteriota bacterium]|nr:sigma-70 family RNA polymerase sigma factor [Ignavibacteriota bacterium]MBW7841927.1 sigma-70 family RNA polymerase sigma factor [Ignavibacterium sp.]MCO6446788.1 sigma-70 family RNA polymerase sigma factor [Ignavibacterium album]MCZ2268290.1 sigma-70 family RNA polymerase sigma factor [Ignavibacteriales bacterium]HOJ07651.1 sigma-70 family RNA polymerase sigma factor [Ignavibacteriaceae bacterium]
MERNFNDLSDEELILEFQNSGNEKAFEILVSRFKNPLINFVYRFLGDYDNCVDVVQDTFIKVYRYKDSYSSLAKFSTWIYTIAGNLARTEYKRKRRKNFFSINSYGEEQKTFDIPDEAYRPDIQTDMKIKSEIIQKALLKVRDTYREAVILRDIQELSYEEIAEIMQIEIGTVKSRINRGRAELQKYLKDIYKD